MTPRTLLIRRLLTAAGVTAIVALGFGSIQAAAAWTAASAPLTVSPATAASLEDDLTFERARSAALVTQLQDLDERTADLEAALAEAQAQIDADTGHASALEDQLAAATTKLTKLDKAIASARKVLAAQAAAARPAATSLAAPVGSGGEREDREDREDTRDTEVNGG